MNYYIQGNAAKADQIKAAFEKLGYDISWPGGCANSDVINIGVERNGAKYVVAETSEYIKDIIKTHPDYKELELPVEHEFNVGDWLFSNSNGVLPIIVKGFSEALGYKVECKGLTYYVKRSTIENEYHLWTIADAKDGDVLMTTKVRNCPFIYRKNVYNNNLAYYYVGIDGNGDFCEGCIKRTLSHFGPVADILPASKEQRDLLFAKIREAGYEWDADKKELRKIKPHYDISNFKPYDKVLTRDTERGHWNVNLFSYYIDDKDERVIARFCCINSLWKQCIPFNDDTKHLLGTTDMPSEEYINW